MGLLVSVSLDTSRCELTWNVAPLEQLFLYRTAAPYKRTSGRTLEGPTIPPWRERSVRRSSLAAHITRNAAWSDNRDNGVDWKRKGIGRFAIIRQPLHFTMYTVMIRNFHPENTTTPRSFASS